MGDGRRGPRFSDIPLFAEKQGRGARNEGGAERRPGSHRVGVERESGNDVFAWSRDPNELRAIIGETRALIYQQS